MISISRVCILDVRAHSGTSMIMLEHLQLFMSWSGLGAGGAIRHSLERRVVATELFSDVLEPRVCCHPRSRPDVRLEMVPEREEEGQVAQSSATKRKRGELALVSGASGTIEGLELFFLEGLASRVRLAYENQDRQEARALHLEGRTACLEQEVLSPRLETRDVCARAASSSGARGVGPFAVVYCGFSEGFAHWYLQFKGHLRNGGPGYPGHRLRLRQIVVGAGQGTACKSGPGVGSIHVRVGAQGHSAQLVLHRFDQPHSGSRGCHGLERGWFAAIGDRLCVSGESPVVALEESRKGVARLRDHGRCHGGRSTDPRRQIVDVVDQP